MAKKIIFLLPALVMALMVCAQVNIIPQPVEVNTPAKAGTFLINKKTKIVAGAGLNNAIEFFNDYLQQFYGFKLSAASKAGTKDAIYFTLNKGAGSVPGAYTLNVTNKGIQLLGNNEEAVFYAMQSLIQLLPASKTAELAVPFVQVKDYPRLAYRGMHLDVSRHYFPPSFVKKYIDFIALHKMNYFHWHLTDDQGWRIEIKKYPGLTKAGAYRDGTIIGHYPGTGNDNIAYGGFYTQDEVKDIVAYAAKRYITVIPEIEMPGHSSAAIAAYPWLSCFPAEETKIPTNPSEASLKKSGKKVQETWGVFPDIYCAGKDSTFMFLENVLNEVVALFPSKYIHVGGDEAPKDYWKICPACQARIKQEGLKNEHELQNYFITRMEKYLNQRGRTVIGWDEILEGGLAPNAVVMSWRGEQGGIDAAKQNHYVIMTPGSHVYFDHSQTRKDDSLTFGGYTTVQKVYSYEPVPQQLNEAQARFILGAQANLWSEYIVYPSKAEYQVFPRMSALSEVLWSPKASRDWGKFKPRLTEQIKRFELWGVHFSKAYFEEASNKKEN